MITSSLIYHWSVITDLICIILELLNGVGAVNHIECFFQGSAFAVVWSTNSTDSVKNGIIPPAAAIFSTFGAQLWCSLESSSDQSVSWLPLQFFIYFGYFSIFPFFISYYLFKRLSYIHYPFFHIVCQTIIFILSSFVVLYHFPFSGNWSPYVIIIGLIGDLKVSVSGLLVILDFLYCPLRVQFVQAVLIRYFFQILLICFYKFYPF